MSLRIHVHGAGGKMGSMVRASLATEVDLVLVGTSGRHDDVARAIAASKPDVVVEFSVGEAAPAAIEAALRAGAHVVSGTTGIASERLAAMDVLARDAGLGLVVAANYALGVVILQRCAALAARHFAAVEILEFHHDTKRDAPSGTALVTARRIAESRRGAAPVARSETILREGARGAREAGVPIHSVRLPGLVAHQEVLFGSTGNVLTLRHDAYDRAAYWPGIRLAIRAVTRRKGLLDSIEPLLDDVP